MECNSPRGSQDSASWNWQVASKIRPWGWESGHPGDTLQKVRLHSTNGSKQKELTIKKLKNIYFKQHFQLLLSPNTIKEDLVGLQCMDTLLNMQGLWGGKLFPSYGHEGRTGQQGQ